MIQASNHYLYTIMTLMENYYEWTSIKGASRYTTSIHTTQYGFRGIWILETHGVCTAWLGLIMCTHTLLTHNVHNTSYNQVNQWVCLQASRQ